MEKRDNKPGFKIARIVGFIIIILGIVFFNSWRTRNKHSPDREISAMKVFGIAAIVIGAGIQIWEEARKKEA